MADAKKLDQYYRRTFNWTLAEVDALYAKQGNVCAICKRPPGTNRLNLDHDHAYDRVRIECVRVPCMTDGWVILATKGWNAHATINGKTYQAASRLKFTAMKAVHLQLRHTSVRGGLCLRCNKGIQMFEDSKAPLSPEERFDVAAKYFRDFKNKVTQ